jgi:uncharacterized protein YdeI (YjbR/CyaY-like superfamily)
MNHASSKGIWMVFGKTVQLCTIKPEEALEEALCFGWIDGQLKSIDETRYIKKFTPRTKNSKWSEKNRNTAMQLIEKGLMTEAGLAAIEQAKKLNHWIAPKPSFKEEQIAILEETLKGYEPAYTNFMNMSFSVRKTYTLHYLDAKSEATKQKRLEQIVGRLNENKKPM